MRFASPLIVVIASCSFPRPADVPDFDAQGDAAIADANLVVDGGIPDAMLGPPVVSGQPADLVLGQPDFSQNSENNGGVSGTSMSHPKDVWSDGTRVWVSDQGNYRVLQWSSFPLVNNAGANAALGQPTLFSNTKSTVDQYKIGGGGLAALSTNYQVSGAVAGTMVFVVDPSALRVLGWSPFPTTSGANATFVLGYANFMTGTPQSPTASNMNSPSGVWTDGTRVAVADTGNNRILLWNTFPTNGKAADLVLGQSTFSTNASGASATSMYLPMGVYFDGSRLFVADAGNNRVMVWNGWPTQSGQGADYVIGQGDSSSNSANAGAPTPNHIGLSHPTDVFVARGALFVADSDNSRVVVHYPIPTMSGTQATAVLGQKDFYSKVQASGADGMYTPTGVGGTSRYLFVADCFNHRVVRFELAAQ